MSSSPISPDALAAAAERRVSQLPAHPSAAHLSAAHERRQAFRRLIDPGILRPNSKEQAMASLKTLLAISENLLREPDNPKFKQFKPTNSIIKRDLVDPKGALEFAIQLGFSPEVKNFQPFYIYNPRRVEDLRLGAAILKEFVDIENEKVERAARSKVDQKATTAAITNQVKLAYMDDRKTKMLRDEREKEQRAARAAAAASAATEEQLGATEAHNSDPASSYSMTDGPPPYRDE